MIVGRSIWQFNLFHTSMVGGLFQTFPLPPHIQSLTILVPMLFIVVQIILFSITIISIYDYGHRRCFLCFPGPCIVIALQHQGAFFRLNSFFNKCWFIICLCIHILSMNWMTEVRYFQVKNGSHVYVLLSFDNLVFHWLCLLHLL